VAFFGKPRNVGGYSSLGVAKGTLPARSKPQVKEGRVTKGRSGLPADGSSERPVKMKELLLANLHGLKKFEIERRF